MNIAVYVEDGNRMVKWGYISGDEWQLDAVERTSPVPSVAFARNAVKLARDNGALWVNLKMPDESRRYVWLADLLRESVPYRNELGVDCVFYPSDWLKRERVHYEPLPLL